MNLGVIVAVAFVMGVLVTIAEPDLQILSEQVPSIPDSILVMTVAIGVGMCLSIAVLRIILHINLSILLMVLYGVLLVFSFLVPKEFLDKQINFLNLWRFLCVLRSRKRFFLCCGTN